MTREVILRYKGRIELSSPGERSRVESAGAKFFDAAQHLCASLAVALPSTIEFNFPNGDSIIFCRQQSNGVVHLTERQKQIVHELLMPSFLELCESIASTEADREKIKKNKETWERAFFGKLTNKKAQRAGAEFLRSLQLAELYHRENPSRGSQALPVIAHVRTVYGSPLFEALIEHNTEFVQGILEQMRRAQSERQKLKKRLVEIDELRHPTGPLPTWKEIRQKYSPHYMDTPQNFQTLLGECGIAFAPTGEFRRKRLKKQRTIKR